MTVQEAISSFLAITGIDPVLMALVLLAIIAIVMFMLRFSGGEALIVMFLFMFGFSSLLGNGVFDNLKAFALVIAGLVIGYFIWTRFANG